MYKLERAVAKKMGLGTRWADVLLDTVPISEIYRTYEKVWLVLSNPFLTDQVALDLELIRNQISGLDITLPEWLVVNGNNTLPTVTQVPTVNTRYALYNDAFRAGYTIQPVAPNASPDAELPMGAKTWLHLTRPKTDWVLFSKSILPSVNGFFHALAPADEGCWIVDGMRTNIVSRQNQLGLLSFRTLGELTYIPITESMLFKQNPDQKMQWQTNINVGVDLSQYTVLLVLGGYLHVLDDRVFRPNGDQTLMVDVQNLPLLERYFESKNYLDFSDFPLTKTDLNENQISLDEFYSDEFLTRYFTMPQSFIVLINNRELFAERSPLRSMQGPGFYSTYEKPNHMLVTGVGKVSEYWAVLEDGVWAINLQDGRYHTRQFQTTDLAFLQTVDEKRLPYKPTVYSNAAFLKLGADI